MNTIMVQNQVQIETIESKLITINGTSSLPTEHVYRVRKQLHPQNTSNHLYLHRTQHSSNNSLNMFCSFCNKHTSFATGRYCGCQERQFHEQCLLVHIYGGYQQGNAIMQCSYCNLYYPTEIESTFSRQNMTRTEQVRCAIGYLTLFLVFAIEILIISLVKMNPLVHICFAILFTIELLILIILIRKTWQCLRLIKFSLKEYRYGDEIIQFVYSANAIAIMQAIKNKKAKREVTQSI